MITLTIKDETTGGIVINQTRLSFSNELATVQEIIAARVLAEVDEYNSNLPEYYKGLVQPGEAEVTLNGFKMKQRKKVDAEKQVFVALQAFNQNGYFVLIDNIQAEGLDQMVVINPNTEVSFIKLTPLVGG